jgi:hypothetical protein
VYERPELDLPLYLSGSMRVPILMFHGTGKTNKSLSARLPPCLNGKHNFHDDDARCCELLTSETCGRVQELEPEVVAVHMVAFQSIVYRSKTQYSTGHQSFAIRSNPKKPLIAFSFARHSQRK